jgi:hypothetical protein
VRTRLAPPGEQESRVRALWREAAYQQKVRDLREEQYRAMGATQRGALTQLQAVIESQHGELEKARVLCDEYRRQLRETQAVLEDLGKYKPKVKATRRPRRPQKTGGARRKRSKASARKRRR